MNVSIVGFRLTFDFLGFGLEKHHLEKIHNYTQQVQGCHYFLDTAEDSHKVYMTADDGGVKCRDYILLKDEMSSAQYQVEVIERYSESPTLWTALLVKC